MAFPGAPTVVPSSLVLALPHPAVFDDLDALNPCPLL